MKHSTSETNVAKATRTPRIHSWECVRISKQLDKIFNEEYFTTIKVVHSFHDKTVSVDIFKNPTRKELFDLDSMKDSPKECKAFLVGNDWYVSSGLEVMHSEIKNKIDELKDSIGITMFFSGTVVIINASGDRPSLDSHEITIIKNHRFLRVLNSFGITRAKIGKENIDI